MSDITTDLLCPAMLALELDAGSMPAQLILDCDSVAELASLIAADLVRLLPGADELSLVVLGAVYDQAQILRPGWPLYDELVEHYTRTARMDHSVEASVIGLGAQAGHMPNPCLEPERELLGGTLLLIPWLLIGDATRATAIGKRMEQDFIAKGEASAATADWLMRQLGLRMQHARYLTRTDLCALASVQLEHAGFGPLWQLLEAALLTPQQKEEAVSSSGQHFFYAQHHVTTTPLGYTAWAQSEAAAYYREPQEFVRGFATYLFELRQYAALLKAHALPLHLQHVADNAHVDIDGYWIETISNATADGECYVFAHEMRGLGVIVLTVGTTINGMMQPLAHAYPVEPAALVPALRELQARYGASGEPIRLGELAIDHVQQTLVIPVQALTMLPHMQKASSHLEVAQTGWIADS